MRHTLLPIALGLILATFALPAQEPHSSDLSAFVAQDAHEGVTIAVRPVLDQPEAEGIFGKNAAPVRVGVLPVELLIINERPEPVRVALERIQVVTDAERFEQVQPEKISWALYPPPKAKKPTTSTRIPTRLPKDKSREKREEAEAALRSRQLRAAVVGPGGQARGYLYFDLGRSSLDLTQARLYVPEVAQVPSGQALFFFEVSLEAYRER